MSGSFSSTYVVTAYQEYEKGKKNSQDRYFFIFHCFFICMGVDLSFVFSQSPKAGQNRQSKFITMDLTSQIFLSNYRMFEINKILEPNDNLI